MGINQARSVKRKMKGRNLGSGVNSYGALKQKMHKTNGRKTKPWCTTVFEYTNFRSKNRYFSVQCSLTSETELL
jgi:hypothetical protein